MSGVNDQTCTGPVFTFLSARRICSTSIARLSRLAHGEPGNGTTSGVSTCRFCRGLFMPANTWPGFWEKFYFKPGNLGFPVFETAYAKVGIYICYDRHFPECARVLALKGADILFNPSATVAGKSQYLVVLNG